MIKMTGKDTLDTFATKVQNIAGEGVRIQQEFFEAQHRWREWQNKNSMEELYQEALRSIFKAFPELIRIYFTENVELEHGHVNTVQNISVELDDAKFQVWAGMADGDDRQTVKLKEAVSTKEFYETPDRYDFGEYISETLTPFWDQIEWDTTVTRKEMLDE